MKTTNANIRQPWRGRPRLTFSPLAWLKLQFCCHLGDTEIAGFGITAKDDLLYVEDFATVRQQTSLMTVAMDDQAVANFADRCVDAGLPPQRFLRVWCHTHPGSSALPSGTDEDTFDRVFGSCDWAVMFILSRTAETYARLSFHCGPGAAVQVPVSVDWSAWPTVLTDPNISLANLFTEWQQEFAANIQRIPEPLPMLSAFPGDLSSTGSPWEPFAETWDWTDLDRELLEDYQRHERSLNHDPQP
jgi:proteasome lid subunit RPN8/RPN11